MYKTSNYLHFLFYFTIIFFLTNCTQPQSNIELPALFTDHIVLQQNTNTPIWGTANSNTKLEIKGSWGVNEKIIADKNGDWICKLKTPKAGGPFEIHISAADTLIAIKDVMIGEVWLCSGQSNMEMPLKGWPPKDLIDNSEEEIQNANYPLIRMFTVQKAIEIKPVSGFSGNWKVCSPATAGNYSATAYFFGKELYESLQVPIGLIHSSWGGTLAEAWTEGKHLSSRNDFKDILTKIENAKPQQVALDKWLEDKAIINNDKLPEDTNWKTIDFKDAALIASDNNDKWPVMNLPQFWEKDALIGFDGIVLFKKEIQVKENLVGKNLVLELGAIDDMEEVYLNGQLVGSTMETGFWNIKRVYDIPNNVVKKGRNTIVIRVIDTGGGGGFSSEASDLKLYAKNAKNQAVSLAGDWVYLPIAEYKSGKLYHYGGSLTAYKERPQVDITINANTPTVLYNGMIAPLIPYAIKGAIWYQGESNAGRAKQYETLFPKMIESWRTQWNQGNFPFYFTQIAPFNYGAPDAIPSAQLRDVQRKSLSFPNTGMAVTLDIGLVDNIHPPNKQDVGKRLAMWALAKDYGKVGIVFSGPLYKGMQVEGNKISISFNHANSGLISKDGELNGFEIADENGQFIPAKAVIDGSSVIVSHTTIKSPKQVRYAYKNASMATLFNKEGLPASTFSTEE